MPSVSILIPAYKTRYLDQALVSARQQTYKDIEILVGDDTSDGKARPIVELHANQDPRVRYFHHGFADGFKNSFGLWHKAQGRYIKWLFDDDVLLPGSVERLVDALQQQPEAILAFHQRVTIDANSQIVETPPLLLPNNQYAQLDRQYIAEKLLSNCINFIGEPSNIMVDRERFGPIEEAYYYQGRLLQFLGDLAVYLNCAARSPLILVGGYLSAFRRHGEQLSNPNSPILSAGCFEWELILRGEVSNGTLDPSLLPSLAKNVRVLYQSNQKRYPELSPLLEGLRELDTPQADPVHSPTFVANLERAYATVAERLRAWRHTEEMPMVCAVCGNKVKGWLPHPELQAYNQLDFLNELDTVGSTLERHLCPVCQCNDRDRHLWLYMSRAGILDDISSKRILHIAPEVLLEPKLLALHPLEYIAGDLHPRNARHQKLNVESLPFENEHFDLIICNHVLEHVDRPDKTLAELARCLSPRGRLVAQTPYSPVLKATLELTKMPSEAFRIRYYGQNDHVRLFGADIINYFRAAGFAGDLCPHDTLLEGVDANAYGVNGNEPFFLFWKETAPALPLEP